MIGRKEAILETLGVVARLEGILLEYNIRHLLASEQSDLVSSMAVENTEKGESVRVCLCGSIVVAGRGPSFSRAVWASSMLMRQPCIAERP